MTETKFFKTIIGILLCAMFALFYAHQEVEIVKSGLLINKNRYEVSLLLDQYRSLVYNLSRLESPERVENTLFANEMSLYMPSVRKTRGFRRRRLAKEVEPERKESFLARLFDRFSTKAEAKVIKD